MPENHPPAAEAWEQVFVRHVVANKRDDIGRLLRVLRPPFPHTSSSATDGGSQELPKIFTRATGLWMFSARFDDQSWAPIFSNAATAEEIFAANADSRRMEVAWLGCKPEKPGWFMRLHRARQPVVIFSHASADDSTPVIHSAMFPCDLLANCRSGYEAFHCLCQHFAIALPTKKIIAVGDEFRVVDQLGQTASGLRGYVCFHGKLKSTAPAS